MPLPAVPDWVVVGAGGDGCYRVRMPRRCQEAARALARLEPIDRFNLAAIFALTRPAPCPRSNASISPLGSPRDGPQWTVAGSFRYVARVISPSRRGLRHAREASTLPAMERLGWEAQPGDGPSVSFAETRCA